MTKHHLKNAANLCFSFNTNLAIDQFHFVSFGNRIDSSRQQRFMSLNFMTTTSIDLKSAFSGSVQTFFPTVAFSDEPILKPNNYLQSIIASDNNSIMSVNNFNENANFSSFPSSLSRQVSLADISSSSSSSSSSSPSSSKSLIISSSTNNNNSSRPNDKKRRPFKSSSLQHQVLLSNVSDLSSSSPSLANETSFKPSHSLSFASSLSKTSPALLAINDPLCFDVEVSETINHGNYSDAYDSDDLMSVSSRRQSLSLSSNHDPQSSSSRRQSLSLLSRELNSPGTINTITNSNLEISSPLNSPGSFKQLSIPIAKISRPSTPTQQPKLADLFKRQHFSQPFKINTSTSITNVSAGSPSSYSAPLSMDAVTGNNDNKHRSSHDKNKVTVRHVNVNNNALKPRIKNFLRISRDLMDEMSPLDYEIKQEARITMALRDESMVDEPDPSYFGGSYRGFYSPSSLLSSSISDTPPIAASASASTSAPLLAVSTNTTILQDQSADDFLLPSSSSSSFSMASPSLSANEAIEATSSKSKSINNHTHTNSDDDDETDGTNAVSDFAGQLQQDNISFPFKNKCNTQERHLNQQYQNHLNLPSLSKNHSPFISTPLKFSRIIPVNHSTYLSEDPKAHTPDPKTADQSGSALNTCNTNHEFHTLAQSKKEQSIASIPHRNHHFPPNHPINTILKHKKRQKPDKNSKNPADLHGLPNAVTLEYQCQPSNPRKRKNSAATRSPSQDSLDHSQDSKIGKRGVGSNTIDQDEKSQLFVKRRAVSP